MNSNFFYRPIWQQYVICFVFFSAIFLIGYLFFIADIEHEADQQMQYYHEKKDEIKLLQTRLDRYQANRNNTLSLISENDLAQAIAHNHLTLNSYKRYETENMINWDIELNGKFIDFIALITSFNDDYFYLDFQRLIINKQEQQLQITFTLVFKKEIE